MNSGSQSGGSMLSVYKDGLIGNVDPQVDYVEIDPKGRYVRVLSFSLWLYYQFRYLTFAYITCRKYAHHLIHMF